MFYAVSRLHSGQKDRFHLSGHFEATSRPSPVPQPTSDNLFLHSPPASEKCTMLSPQATENAQTPIRVIAVHKRMLVNIALIGELTASDQSLSRRRELWA